MLICAKIIVLSDFFCVVGVELSQYVLSSLKSIKCYIMAKIKFGMMMTDARGKLGGQVFSKNRSGAYVRTKVTPVNPRTTDQQANRSLLGSLSANWSGLTEAQRNAWNGAVESWQRTNVFGDLTKPTGKNLFTSLNKVLLQAFPSNDMLLLPPAKVEFAPFIVESASYNIGSGAFTIQLGGSVEAGATYQVRATGATSVGTTYVNNLLRGLGEAFVSGAGNVLTITSAYAAKFGSVGAGNSISVEVRQVATNGQLGAPQIVRANFS